MGSDVGKNEWHNPVMVEEVKTSLVIDPDGVYIDGTLGGGGHAAAILETLSEKALYVGIDRDATAIEHCEKRFIGSATPVRVFQGNFPMMPEIADSLGIKGVSGVLLDLGVSSNQIAVPRRGFSFTSDGPLDMRMDQSSGEPAYELLNRLSERELANLIYTYGEERHSRKIAAGIKKASPIMTTSELRSVIEKVIMGNMKTKSLARVFQALRIAVNDELTNLLDGLTSTLKVLKKGGRLVVLSYHSLEDRIVKKFMKEESSDCICPPERLSRAGPPEVSQCVCDHTRQLKVITKRVMKPTEEETKVNPRSRSARMRVAERL